MNNVTLKALCYLHAWEQGLELPGGLAFSELLQEYKLDYSVASLDRIDSFLDTLRTRYQPKEEDFFKEPANQNLLSLLAFYTGELIGRTLGCPPMWISYQEAAPSDPFNPDAGSGEYTVLCCDFPGDTDAQFGHFTPMYALSTRLFSDWGDKSIRFSSELFMPVKYQQAPLCHQALPPLPPQRSQVNIAEYLESCTPQQREVLMMTKPYWADDDKISYLFQHVPTLLKEGQVVRGALIQANSRLFKPEFTLGAGGEVIYDPNDRLDYEDLKEIAGIIYSLKGKPMADPALKFFSDYLADEMTRVFGLDVPDSVLPYPLKVSSTYFDQLHLPDGMLSSSGIPLLISDRCPGAVMLLPCQFWSEGFKEKWLQASEAKHGQRYDVEQLKQQALKRTADAMARAAAQTDNEEAQKLVMRLGYAPKNTSTDQPQTIRTQTAGLGGLIHEYRKSWALPFVFLLFFGFPAYLLIDNALDNEMPVIPLLSGLALLAPSFIALIDRSFYRLRLYEGGIACRHVFGTVEIPFDTDTKIWHKNIREFINGIPAGRPITIKLQNQKRKLALHTGITAIEDLRDMLVEAEETRIKPAIRQAYEQNKLIEFGPVRLQQGTIFFKKKPLSASKVSALKLDQGILSIFQTGQTTPFCKISLSELPNVLTFLELLQSLCKQGIQ